jgi:uncharacterized membrane protein YbaN (DUF454 family)
MNTRQSSGKFTASLLIVACVVIGVAGLVLPIIPGLLFLAIAALIAARHFPSIEARLRRHRAVREHLGIADRFRHLDLAAKAQVVGWLCVRTFVGALAFVASLIAKVRAAAR